MREKKVINLLYGLLRKILKKEGLGKGCREGRVGGGGGKRRQRGRRGGREVEN